MAEDADIQLLFCYGSTAVHMRSPDPFIRGYAVEHLKKAVEAAAKLGGTKSAAFSTPHGRRTTPTI